jgi:acyl transferase domain-containing protein
MTNGYNTSQSPHRLLVWSAADEKALGRMTHSYQAYIHSHIAGSPKKLDRLAYTLAARRSRLNWRTFALISPQSLFTEQIDLSLARPIRCSSTTQIGFLFTGQGAQYTNMGSDLLVYPAFEASLQRTDKIIQDFGCEWSLFGKKIRHFYQGLCD